jgi:hypothetical protein
MAASRHVDAAGLRHSGRAHAMFVGSCAVLLSVAGVLRWHVQVKCLSLLSLRKLSGLVVIEFIAVLL